MATEYDQNFQEVYAKLNDKQKEAVDALEGPVLVLAGPGTGKTQILTSRIANILTKTDTAPYEILALTFTESGVRAMRERLRSIIGPTAYDVNIYTFHSFATDVIKSNPSKFIVYGDIEPLSDLERVFIVREILDENDLKMIKPFNATYYYLDAISDKIKTLKREGISPDEFAEIIKTAEFEKEEKLKNEELLIAYRAYQDKLKKRKRYDFEDMINFVNQAFRDDPDFLLKYQEKFLYYLVDEFQDTNGSQFELLNQLAMFNQDSPNLFVVGDDDQSIYRFQGASIDNIKDFLNNYPTAQKVILDTNYRNAQKIIDASTSLISKNENRIANIHNLQKKFKYFDKDNGKSHIEKIEFINHYAESFYIADKIRNLISEGVEPAEIAVIYRNNRDVEPLAEMFTRLGIRYQIAGGENVLTSGIIVRLRILLNVIANIDIKKEEEDVFTLMNYEFIDLKPIEILRLARFATTKKQSLFEALTHEEINSVGINFTSFNEFFEKLAEWQEYAHNINAFDFVKYLIAESNYLNWILGQKDNFRLLNKLNSFLSEVKRLNISDKNLTLKELVHILDLMDEHHIRITEEELNLSENSVNLMTAHKSKGLEFRHVFIPFFIDKKWGNNVTRNLIKLPFEGVLDKKVQKQLTDEDERRLVYVAMTRAKETINLSHAKTYGLSGEKDAVSSKYEFEIDPNFLTEVKDEKYDQVGIELLQTIVQSRMSDNSSPDEEQFLKSALSDFKLSATSLNTYLTCHYKFKLDFLFRTPRASHKALVLGDSLHSALEHGYKSLIEGTPPTIEFMIQKFNDKLDNTLVDKKDYKDIKADGEVILRRYYETYKDEFTNLESNILFIEKYLGNSFDLPILDKDILLFGKIDKITDLGDNKIRITDYKSGKPKTRNEVLGNTQSSDGGIYRQMLFYKLVAELSRKNKFNVAEIQVDFLGDRKTLPKRENFDVSAVNMDEIKEEVRQAWDGIHKLDFTRVNKEEICSKCAYLKHCWPNGFGQQELT